MQGEEHIVYAVAVATIIVNIVADILVIKYQRRKWKPTILIIISMSVVNIIYAINRTLPYLVNSQHTAESITNQLTMVACTLLCFHILSLTILSYVNVNTYFKEKFKGRVMQISFTLVIASWITSLIILTPVIVLDPEHGSSFSDRFYHVVIPATIFGVIVLLFLLHTYVIYRTWINEEIENIVNFSTNRKIVLVVILLSVLYVSAFSPYGLCKLQTTILWRSNIVYGFLWLDKIFSPVLYTCFMTSGSICRSMKLSTSPLNHDQSYSNKNQSHNKVHQINSFTHVQQILKEEEEEEEDQVEDVEENASYV